MISPEKKFRSASASTSSSSSSSSSSSASSRTGSPSRTGRRRGSSEPRKSRISRKKKNYSVIHHLQENLSSAMGNFFTYFDDQKEQRSRQKQQQYANQQIDSTPRDLPDLLQDHHRAHWVPKFKVFLSSMDERTGQHWRSALLDFVLLCRAVKANQAQQELLHASPNRRKKAKKQKQKKPKGQGQGHKDAETLIEERNKLLREMDSRFLNDESESPVGLSDAVLRSRLAFEVHEEKTRTDLTPVYDDFKTENVYSLVWSAHNDPLVWTKLEKLCDKFLKDHALNASKAMAVLLSIL